MLSANHDKVEFKLTVNTYTPYCSSIVQLLLYRVLDRERVRVRNMYRKRLKEGVERRERR